MNKICCFKVETNKIYSEEDNQQPNHDKKITSNYWGYCKETFKKKDEIKPNFDKETRETYLKNTFKQRNSNKTYQLPTWM